VADSFSNASHSRRTGLLRRVGRAGIALVALMILFACFGAIYQAVGNWRDARRFPQQGTSVQTGQVKLNLDCSGQGRPTVVLDSGSGVPAIGWLKVQPEVAKFARVCSYDRAGYGWSELGPEPRTSLQIAKELKALLNSAGENGPYVLVGHSFGGFNVRVYTGLYPEDVVGVVLVDALHEDEDKRITEILPVEVLEQENRNELWNERVNRFLTPLRIHLGILRLQVATGWGTPVYGILQSARSLPKEFRQELLYLRQQEKFQRAVASESSAFSDTVSQVRAAGNLGDRPLVVLTAGKPYDDPLLTREQLDKEGNLWINVLQAEEAHLSTRGKQIVVPDSGHMIPFERPDAVVSAIKEVWSAARAGVP
jgi:pimeloyl-ACP methyl ester carboxylesterase